MWFNEKDFIETEDFRKEYDHIISSNSCYSTPEELRYRLTAQYYMIQKWGYTKHPGQYEDLYDPFGNLTEVKVWKGAIESKYRDKTISDMLKNFGNTRKFGVIWTYDPSSGIYYLNEKINLKPTGIYVPWRLKYDK